MDRQSHNNRAENTRSLHIFSTFQYTYAGTVDTFISGYLKSTEYFSSIFFCCLIQRDKAIRVLLGACNFSELQASLSKDGQFLSLVWQDCARSHLVLVNKGGLYENMSWTVQLLGSECAGCSKNSCLILKCLLYLLTGVSLW